MDTENKQIPEQAQQETALEESIPEEKPSALARPVEDFQLIEVAGSPFFLYNDSCERYFVSQDGKQIFQSEDEILLSLNMEGAANSSKMTLEELFNQNSQVKTDVIGELVDLLKQYCYLQDERQYMLIAVYVIMTHCYRFFNRIPYVSLRGEKGSGKTTLMLLMQAVSYKPQLFSSITPSALFHIIDSTGPTLFLDEAESLMKRSSSNSPIFQIINSGYQADGRVSRVELGKAVEYSTYCPKVIAGINPLLEATEDRCLTVMMERAQDKENLKPLVDGHRLSSTAGEIIRQINNALSKASSSVLAYYRDPSGFKLSPEIKNRDLDKWLPILSISKALSTEGKNYFKELTGLALMDIRRKKEAEENLPENTCKRLITDLVKKNKPGDNKILKKDHHFYYVSAEEFFYEVTQKDINNSYNGQAEVTIALKKANIQSTRQRFKSEPIIVYKVPVCLTDQAK